MTVLGTCSLRSIRGDVRNGGIGPPSQQVLVGCFKVNHSFFKIANFLQDAKKKKKDSGFHLIDAGEPGRVTYRDTTFGLQTG